MESSGDNSLLSARSAVARTTRVFYVSFNTTIATAVTAASSYATPSMSNRGVPSDYDENNRGFPRGASAGVVPAPTLAASDNSNFLLEYGAIIASIAVGIIFLVGLIVFLALRYRGSRNEVQVAGASGKTRRTRRNCRKVAGDPPALWEIARSESIRTRPTSTVRRTIPVRLIHWVGVKLTRTRSGMFECQHSEASKDFEALQ
jgi:hypothetical protein